MDEAGNNLHYEEEITKRILQFFTELYSADHSLSFLRSHEPSSGTPLQLISHMTKLDRPLRDIKIQIAVKSFKPFKVPSPGELHPMFYQKY